MISHPNQKFFGGPGGSFSKKPPSIYDFKMKDIDGKDVSLDQFKGKFNPKVKPEAEELIKAVEGALKN